jgi:photosystem II oxygen-evolving enhancer protein 2
MLKRVIALLLVVLSLSLQSCVPAVAGSGLKAFIDDNDGYRFLYPNGWVQVKVSNGPDVVFHDIIEPSENVSVVINPVPGKKKLTDLGTASEVGYQLSKNAIAPPDSGRVAELVSAEPFERNGNTYYRLEYAVKLPNGAERHNLASAVINRGRLYTFNASVTAPQWEKLKGLLEQSVASFTTD